MEELEMLNQIDKNPYIEAIYKILGKLEPFKMDLFKELTDQTDIQVKKFGNAGKIVLLLGMTGSGKSTLV